MCVTNWILNSYRYFTQSLSLWGKLHLLRKAYKSFLTLFSKRLEGAHTVHEFVTWVRDKLFHSIRDRNCTLKGCPPNLHKYLIYPVTYETGKLCTVENMLCCILDGHCIHCLSGAWTWILDILSGFSTRCPLEPTAAQRQQNKMSCSGSPTAISSTRVFYLSSPLDTSGLSWSRVCQKFFITYPHSLRRFLNQSLSSIFKEKQQNGTLKGSISPKLFLSSSQYSISFDW